MCSYVYICNGTYDPLVLCLLYIYRLSKEIVDDLKPIYEMPDEAITWVRTHIATHIATHITIHITIYTHQYVPVRCAFTIQQRIIEITCVVIIV